MQDSVLFNSNNTKIMHYVTTAWILNILITMNIIIRSMYNM